jgi:hypothetical protein
MQDNSSKSPANNPSQFMKVNSSIDNNGLDQQGRKMKGPKRFVCPQYLVEPQHIERYVEGRWTAYGILSIYGRTIPGLLNIALKQNVEIQLENRDYFPLDF